MRVRTLLVALGLVGAALTSVEGSAVADEAAYDFVELNLTDVTDSVVDEANGLAYFSGAATDDRIVVANSQGAVVKEITGVTGATDLALSPDGSKLYAAVPTADAIAEIDTASGAVRLVDTGPDSCPYAVAATGANVWYAHDDGCNRQWTVLHVLDMETGTSEPALGSYPRGWYHNPEIRYLPSTQQLLINDRGISTSTIHLIDTGTRAIVAEQQVQGFLGNLTTNTERSEVFAPTSWTERVQIYRLSDLAPSRELTFAREWASPAGAGDDLHLAMPGDDGTVGVFDWSAGSLRNSIRFGAEVAPGIAEFTFLKGKLLAASIAGGRVRLFHSPAPATPAPILTAGPSGSAYAGHPTTISGVLSDGDAPLSGVPVRLVRDDDSLFAVTTTAADGTWSVTHTWKSRAWVELRAIADRESPAKSSVTRFTFEVRPAPSTITVTGPDSVPAGADIEVSGRLVSDDVGIADTTVHWQASCLDPGASGPSLAQGNVVTDTEGAFDLSWTPTTMCRDHRIHAYWDGNDEMADAGASHLFTVDWPKTELATDMPDEVWMLDDVAASVTVTVDGAPAANRSVNIWLSNPSGHQIESRSVTTDADGRATSDFSDLYERGDFYPETFTLRATVARTPDTMSATATRTFTVRKVPSTITFSAADDSVKLGEAVLVSGRLERADGRNGGADIDLSADDERGGIRHAVTTTDPEGNFQFRDLPSVTGRTTYWIRYEGDGERYLPTDRSLHTSVAVEAVSPGLRLTADRTSYTAGQTARLTIDTAAVGAGAEVTVKATEAGGTARVIFRGTVPDAGKAISYPVRFNTTFTATAAATASTKAETRSLSRTARLSATTRAIGGTIVGGRRSYPAASDPAFVTSVKPDRAGCLRYQLQRLTDSGWRSASTSTCRWIRDRQARFTLMGSQSRNVGYRLRPSFAGDSRNTATTGAWVYFRFR